MPQFFSNKRLIVLLVSIIVLVALIGFSMKERDALTLPEQFFKDSVGWIQSIFYKPAQSVAGFFENVGEMKDMYEENKLLKSRLQEYAKQSEELKLVRSENERLQKELDIMDTPELRDYEVYHASLIARSPDRWNDFLTLNKGSQDGIETNMAVITPEGLIGKIKNVQPFSSTVQLVSDLDRTNRIAAMVQDENGKALEKVFGTIEGYDPEKKALMFNKIPVDVDVKKGQTVITAGNGGIFPRGLIIGKIVDVKTDEVGLMQTAYVKPAADLYDVYHVMIVERSAQEVQNEPTDEEGGE
ncbi:rod shape-determining protein MreC [Pseudalkalibacillus caeni]|uniref:Cell shape-determining protein MreC n=1 Tax=Exobacillus caeni TaxID=2574798 RepID=A0A5R9FEE4_9BACL|nr:rod shape-determining protein MreC [Pseudalkalibacillus caeni]TLS39243.1 rod shape-determining protein MreC [Pseudalkalibacillus caeni]